MNVCVLIDNSWDNVPIMLRRLRKLPTDCKIHTIYSPKLKNIERSSRKCVIQILRHSAKTTCDAISNVLSICDACFLFHNMVEYNTSTGITMESCKNDNIPCFVFSEHTKDYYFDECLISVPLSKKLTNIPIRKKERVLVYNEMVNDYTKIKILPSMMEIRDSLQESYEKNKKTRQIITLYDKDMHKEEKMSTKIEKAARHLEYTTKRINYYKK